MFISQTNKVFFLWNTAWIINVSFVLLRNSYLLFHILSRDMLFYLSSLNIDEVAWSLIHQTCTFSTSYIVLSAWRFSWIVVPVKMETLTLLSQRNDIWILPVNSCDTDTDMSLQVIIWMLKKLFFSKDFVFLLSFIRQIERPAQLFISLNKVRLGICTYQSHTKWL